MCHSVFILIFLSNTILSSDPILNLSDCSAIYSYILLYFVNNLILK